MGSHLRPAGVLTFTLAFGATGFGSPALAQSTTGSPSPDPAAGTVTLVGSVRARDIGGGRTQTLLPDGRVLIIDGTAATTFDPATGRLAPAGELRTPREWTFTSTLLPDGRVLVLGGVQHGKRRPNGSRIQHVRPIEAWDPVTATFADAGRLGIGRVDHATILLQDGSVLVVGGQHDVDWLTAGERHVPDTATFDTVEVPRNVVEGTGPPKSALLADGKVILTGGYRRDGRIPVVTWDPVTGALRDLDPVDVPPPAVPMPLPDGRVLVVGTGEAVGCNLMGPCRPEAGAVVLDPATGRSTPLFARRERLGVSILPDGRVLVAWGGTRCEASMGASDPCTPTPASAELWDPASGSATPLGAFPDTAEDLGRGITLTDGRVLLSGADTLWLVDPDSGSIDPAGALPAGIAPDADLVPLADGRALAIGDGGTVAVWAPTP